MQLRTIPSRRVLRRACQLAAAAAAGTSALPAFAQTIAPSALPLAQSGWSGPGFYFSLLKLTAFIALYLLWVKIGDWVNQDVQRLHLDAKLWNPLVFFVFAVGFGIGFLLIPIFPVAVLLGILAVFVPFVAYVVHRNGKVDREDRVFTPLHIRKVIGRLSGKKVVELGPDDRPPPIRFQALGPSEQVRNLRMIPARQHPGYQAARELTAGAVERRAEAAMFDIQAGGAACQYEIDGVWMNGSPLPLQQILPAVEALKILCGLNPQDHVNRQEGRFEFKYADVPLSAVFMSQGASGGEKVLLRIQEKQTRFRKLEDLNMRPKLQEQLAKLLNEHRGMIVLSAPPGHGLRTTVTCALTSADRFSREWISIQEENAVYQPVENVHPHTYKAAERALLPDMLDKWFHLEPNVVVFRDIPDGEVLELTAREVENDRLIITTVRAKDCCEALLRLAALQPRSQTFPKAVIGVLNQRVLRRLCDACKQPYPPPPELLQRLGIPPGRVQALYRPGAPTQERPEPCPQCQGLGYLGRAAFYELLQVNDTVRKVLAGKPDYATLRKAAKAAGMVSLQEEGVLLVAQGVTTLEELQRVLQKP
ncbi:MAG: GspE/PulE family protein [Thermogutta sp.]